MKKPVSLAALMMAVIVSAVFAENQRPRVEQPNDPTKHHQDLTLRVTADQPTTFALPASNSPIRIDLSASAIGSVTGQQPNPILRSATFLHNSLTDAIFVTDGNSPAVAIGQSGISFTNQPGPDGVRVTISLGLSPKGVPKQLEFSVPEAMSGFTQIEIRIALWY